MFPTRRIITSGGDVYRDQYSLEFDGTNDYVNAGGTFQSTFQGSFTVAGWFKPSDGRPSANQMLFGAYKGDATNGIQLYIDSANIASGALYSNY